MRGLSSAVTIAALLAVGYLGGHWLSPAHEEAEPADESTAPAVLATDVKLPAAKISAGGIQTVVAEIREIRQTATVPGSIGYDELRHVELKMPLDGVVEELYVHPGQRVQAGQRLARLSSDALAVARNDVLRSEAEIRLAQTRYAWQQEIHKNLVDLLEALEAEQPIDEIDTAFSQRSLGESREQLLASYSNLRRAADVLRKSRDLKQQGVISGRLFQQRLADWEQSSARFRALCEQTRFDAKQSLAVAEAELQVAKRTHDANLETLRLLLGPFAKQSAGQRPSEFELHAPIAGSIAELRAVSSLRVAKNDLLAVVADMDHLWLSATIHQRHWAATNLQAGAKVTFRVPAHRDRTWTATVKFVGTQLVRDTHFLPIVAEVDNRAGTLRPGMFAWVTVPLTAPIRALAVPQSAVQRHEGNTFVFVDVGENQYRRVDVKLGEQGGGWVAVSGNLSAGDKVVSAGAFYLKSELLLERDAE